jgi:hypothetical protein
VFLGAFPTYFHFEQSYSLAVHCYKAVGCRILVLS